METVWVWVLKVCSFLNLRITTGYEISLCVGDLVGLVLVEEENLRSFENDRTLQLKLKEMSLNKFWTRVSAEICMKNTIK